MGLTRRAPGPRVAAVAALVLTGAVAVVVPLVGGIATAPVAAAAGAPCPAAPAGRISVTVVIDDGSGVRIRCVEVADRATGGEALLAAATVRRDDPTKGPAFVCGIDGVPATGCAAVNEPYWSYWTGGTGWSYQNVGAFGYRLPARCSVEGWRFGTGKVPPAIAVPPTPCSAPPPTAPPATAPPTTARPGAVPPPAAPPAPPSAGAGGPVATTPAPLVAGATTIVPGPAAPGGPAPASAGTDPGADPGPDPPAAATPTSAAAPAPGATGTSSGDRGVTAGPEEVAATASRRRPSGAPGPGWAIVVAVVAIAGLGAAAWARSRRDSPPSAV
ncbi:MAG: hypothetical protein ACOYOP_12370 [Microthrixaceae bacterium]